MFFGRNPSHQSVNSIVFGKKDEKPGQSPTQNPNPQQSHAPDMNRMNFFTSK